jgi:SAM-dependent methyltransferase
MGWINGEALSRRGAAESAALRRMIYSRRSAQDDRRIPNVERPFMTQTRVKKYYTATVRKEWNRLARNPYARLEYDTTFHFLEKYLPKTGRILDAGGGPGRYTVELARRGYRPLLLDLTPANVQFARRKIRRAGMQDRVEDVVEGSIADLSRFGENSFDAVICLGGPLSHVLDRRRRERAVSELIRVAKRGAPVFVSVMSRLSVLIVELTLFPHELEIPFYKTARDTGDYPGMYGFTACHFFLPEEFERAFQNKGVRMLELAGLQGLSARQPRAFNALAKNKKRMSVWMQTHFQTCTHPSVVGLSEHMLWIGRKKA